MEFVINAIPSILCAVILALMSRMGMIISNINKQQKANNDATFVMLQNTILQLCKEHQSHGYITAHDGEMLQHLFEQYVAMHGNGYVAKQVEATLTLPQTKEND